METSLLGRYNQPVPRYTSYPTVPFWSKTADIPRWKEDLAAAIDRCNADEGISLYIHLPFCESLCLYCGCTKKITTNHGVEEAYIDTVLQEWQLYRSMIRQPPQIRELHLGGGTPTFFSPASLRRLLTGILSTAIVHPDHAFSVEGHPNNTSREHLDTLAELGFRRVSYGVQDLTPEVQRAIGRLQPYENVRRATTDARAAGFSAVNFDLIYGLPLQTPERLLQTLVQALELEPDRIAFYSYAHTPAINCNQRLIDPALLPSPDGKTYLHQMGNAVFMAYGYHPIGMDHFALSTDELYEAWRDGGLHRNFMGYTTRKSGVLLGLGMSAISDTGTAFAQNDKGLARYYKTVASGELAITRNYFLSAEDLVFRKHILDIACKGATIFDPAWPIPLQQWTLPRLRELEKDGLVTLTTEKVTLTDTGRPLLRHVCKAFDLHLLRDEKARDGSDICGHPPPTFSTAI